MNSDQDKPHDMFDIEETIANNECEQRNFCAQKDDHNKRLDHVLHRVANEFSRSYLQQLIDQGHVRVNDLPAKKCSQKIKIGQQIVLNLIPTDESLAFLPEPIPLDVVFEDEHLLVINKKAGLVVHPAPGNWRGTLLNGLLAREKLHSQLPRAGIVHRLDKDTSGLMVVAKTRPVMMALVDLIAKRDVHREYIAIAHGRWNLASSLQVNDPIGRDPRNRLKMSVVNLEYFSGKEARTDISLLNNHETMCAVRCKLHTGRTHQIRVHMAHLGHPLIADAVYGGRETLGMSRQALHATKLAFTHPATKQELLFECEAPPDFSNLMQALVANGLA